MKMSKEHFLALQEACLAVLPAIRNPACYGMRQRWDVLWSTGFDVESLYRVGLNDEHIDSALRFIAR